MAMTFFRIYIFCFFVLLSELGWAATEWQEVAPGLFYTVMLPHKLYPWGRIHAFRFKLKNYRLATVLASDHAQKSSSVERLARANNALIAVNGGFFSPDLKPIGLRIKNGKVRNPLKQISWWGVFYTRHQRARLVAQKSYRHRRGIDFAVQGGPRLIVQGRIPNLKPGIAERTALGINRRGEIILLVTEKDPMTTTELAEIMRKPEKENGLACIDALNLDGGSSTQLYAKIGKFELDSPGFSFVTDAVIVTKR